ncbi:MAG: hypothetical protein ACK4M6_04850 [Hyphomonas sp.]
MFRLKLFALAFAILACACSQPTPATAQELHVTAPGYSLKLNGDWSELPSDDPEQKTFVSPAHDVRLVISAFDVSGSEIEPQEAAEALVQIRINAEGEAAVHFGRLMTIAEPVVAPQPWGAMVAYYGHDDTGRQFNFAGMVTRQQILQTYVESPTLSGDALFEVFQEIQQGLTFDQTP